MNKIPKIIHYCWFGGNKLSGLSHKCIESWKKNCPDYEIIRWDENNFDIKYNRYVKEAYESKNWAFVSDYVRLYVVYKYGGIYLDTDVELLKNLDQLLKYSGFMGFEDQEKVATGLGFGAIKNNEIIYEMLMDYENISFIKEDGSFDLMPCPQRNTNSLLKRGLITNNSKQIIDDMVFLPTEYMCPKDYTTDKLNVTDNTYSIHHYNASWHTDEQRKWDAKGVKYRKIFGKIIGNSFINLEILINRYGYLGTLKKVIWKTKMQLHLKNLFKK